jgi:hypothetical protein
MPPANVEAMPWKYFGSVVCARVEAREPQRGAQREQPADQPPRASGASVQLYTSSAG